MTWTLPSADGTSNQVLTTNGSGTLSWSSPAGSGTVTSVGLSMPTGFSVSGSPVTGSGTLAVTTTLNGILKGNGSGFTTATASTDYAPATTGTSAQLLANNGTGGFSNVTVGSNLTLSAGTLSATGGLAWQSVQTTGFTAVAGRAYPCNTTSAAFTVTLPASPSAGNQVQLLDYAGTWQTNNLTVARNGSNINGSASNPVLFTNRGAITLTYIDATQGWVASDSFRINLEIPVEYLVVGGGGGGGGVIGGGGGAGGFRTATGFSCLVGSVLTVTVGAGGAGGVASSWLGTSGSNSVFSTITSAGGGGGNAESSPAPTSGGSGGGAGYNYNGSGGAGNTPSVSPSQGNNGGSSTGNGNTTGGGGGAGAAGGNSSTSVSGNGGAGTASSISGSSVTYAGGGGGGSRSGYTAGTGGSGGGSNGTNGSAAPTAATANTGGGGGGAGISGTFYNGAAGGSGIVIVRYPDTYPAASATTGSPTITVSGGYRTYTWTGNGSITL